MAKPDPTIVPQIRASICQAKKARRLREGLHSWTKFLIITSLSCLELKTDRRKGMLTTTIVNNRAKSEK